MMTQFTHINQDGEANMVDVSTKAVTVRKACAEAWVEMQPNTLQMIMAGNHHKGDVFATARIAGIQAAKRCPELIPLCHPLMLSKVSVAFEIDEPHHRVRILATCKLAGQTGVEMEALTSASVAALTIFDMCKAVDPLMTITGIRVLEKQGGQSGHWTREEAQ